MGGHFVQGHVDGIVHIVQRLSRQDGAEVTFELPTWLAEWIMPRASVAIDGVSLTVQAVSPLGFSVALVPETLARTTLGSLTEHSPVNIEADMLIKSVAHILQVRRNAY
jgi:riboflavin synthase